MLSSQNFKKEKNASSGKYKQDIHGHIIVGLKSVICLKHNLQTANNLTKLDVYYPEGGGIAKHGQKLSRHNRIVVQTRLRR